MRALLLLLVAGCNPPIPEDTDVDTDPPALVCSTYDQDCTSSRKCAPVYDEAFGVDADANVNATDCVVGTGTVVAGSPCSKGGGTDNCSIGNWCMVDGTRDVDGTGICVALCGGSESAPTCAGTALCVQDLASNLAVCLDTCDPVAQDCATNGLGCYGHGDDFLCWHSGDVAEGAECDAFDDCLPGNDCRGATANCTGDACCTPFCTSPGDTTGCDTANSEQCVVYSASSGVQVQGPADHASPEAHAAGQRRRARGCVRS